MIGVNDMKCTYCNQEIEDASVFCELCGMNQNEKIVPLRRSR